MYKNLDEAVETILKGKDFFKKVFGEHPLVENIADMVGNDFSDESINKSGFSWWCRFWSRNQRRYSGI